MEDKKAVLIPDGSYHVYNRANGNECLFLSDKNYNYFLQKYIQFISPIADTFCYCLMPNHFHFLIRIKSEESLNNTFKVAENKTFKVSENLEGLISKQFSNFFNAYAKAFNKQQNRKGNLFMHTFKRKRITDEKYLRKLVHYIHYNPKEAGLVSKIEEWKFSSYNAILDLEGFENLPGLILLKEEVLDWFEDKENFFYCHKMPPTESGIEGF